MEDMWLESMLFGRIGNPTGVCAYLDHTSFLLTIQSQNLIICNKMFNISSLPHMKNVKS